MAETPRQRLLEMAASRLGKEALAARLNVPPHLLDAWMRGLAAMPDRKLTELASFIEKLEDAPR